MNLENIMLSERKRPHILWLDVYVMTRIGKPTERDNRLMFAKGWEEKGNGEWMIMRTSILFGDHEDVLEFDSGDGCTTLWIY